MTSELKRALVEIAGDPELTPEQCVATICARLAEGDDAVIEAMERGYRASQGHTVEEWMRAALAAGMRQVMSDV